MKEATPYRLHSFIQGNLLMGEIGWMDDPGSTQLFSTPILLHVQTLILHKHE